MSDENKPLSIVEKARQKALQKNMKVGSSVQQTLQPLNPGQKLTSKIQEIPKSIEEENSESIEQEGIQSDQEYINPIDVISKENENCNFSNENPTSYFLYKNSDSTQMIEIDLVYFRLRGKEEREVNISFSGLDEVGSLLSGSVRITSESEFNRLKSFFTNLKWNESDGK